MVLLTQMDHMLTTTEVPLSWGSSVKSAHALLNAGSVRSSAQSKFRVVCCAGTSRGIFGRLSDGGVVAVLA